LQQLSLLEPDELLARYQPVQGVRLNLAVNAKGSVAGESGSSDDVSNSLDRALLVHLRKQSDVIVTSGATARAENLRPSQYAPMVVLTPSGRLDGLQDLLKAKWPLTIIVSPDAYKKTQVALATDGVVANLVQLTEFSPESVLKHLAAQGYSRILLEFGPTLSNLWTLSGCIDEICLTTTGLAGLQQVDLEGNVELPSFFETAFTQVEDDVYVAAIQTRFTRFRNARPVSAQVAR
jgi:riboflavin biosynthesis pyrimidine reductase